MTGQLISRGGERHYCDPPGWRERRRLEVKLDALWRCDCGVLWRWDQDWDCGKGWAREYEVEDALKNEDLVENEDLLEDDNLLEDDDLDA